MTLSSLFRFLASFSFFLIFNILNTNAQCSLVSVSGPNGQAPLTLCDGGPAPTKVCFKASSYASRIRFVITDTNDNIITDFNKQCVDFSIFPSGVSRVYAISYAYFFTGQPGDNIYTDTIAGYCQVVSENFIEIFNTPGGGSSAGTVRLTGGDTELAICVGDGQQDILSFENTAVLNGASFKYIVTDDQNVVVDILSGNSGEFDDGNTGVRRIYGLVYQGALPVALGDTLDPLSLAGCTDLSDNFVEITKAQVEGGVLLTDQGLEEVDLCPGDGVPDVLTMVANGASSAPYVFLITDPNGLIEGVSGSPVIDFDAFGPGNYVVWGLSFTGNLLAQQGDVVDVDQLADGCFELSEPVVVVSEDPDGGTVALPDGATQISICPGNGAADFLEFEKITTSGAAYAFLLTDEQGQITHVLNGISAFDFENLGEGQTHVYGVSYVGQFLAAVGMNINTDVLADPCFDLSSNFIAVTREVPVGGMVQLQNGGGDEVVVCSGDGQPDIVAFESTGNSGGNYRFMLTDSFGNILSLLNDDNIDLDGTLGGDEWRIYGASYTGDFLAFLGDNVNMPLSSDCYDLSQNYIKIDLRRVDGGVVYIPGNPVSYETILCPDGNATVSVDSSNLGSVDYAFVLTDTNNVVIEVSPDDAFSLSGFPVGTYRIHGLSWEGTLLAAPGDTAGVDPLASDCESLSQNFVTVEVRLPQAGALSTADGENAIGVCSQDGEEDPIEFVNQPSSAFPFALIVVKQGGEVALVTNSSVIDFETFDPSEYTVYGVAYTGNLTIAEGDLSDDCFDIADQVVEVSVFDQNGPCNGVTLYADCPEGSLGEEICIPVLVDGFTEIFGAQFSIHWDTAVLQFTTAGNFNPAVDGLTVDNLNTQTEGTAAFLWADLFLAGVSLPDSSILFELCFEVVGQGASPFTFDGNPVEVEFSSLSGLSVLTVPAVVESCLFESSGFNPPGYESPQALEYGESSGFLQELSFFPNPAVVSAQVSWRQQTDALAVVRVYDAFGQLRSTKRMDGMAGRNMFRLDLDGYQPGVYCVEVTVGGESREMVRFVKH